MTSPQLPPLDPPHLFQTLVEHSTVAMALLSGPQFVVSWANDSVITYWGRPREQMMNKPLFEALPPARGQGYEALLTGVYTTGERFVAKELSIALERKGRVENTYIDFVYEPYRQADGTITGVTVVCVEVTREVVARKALAESEARYRALSGELEDQVRQRTQQLQDSVHDLQRSNENLQQFAYVASHDLQEPLRKIQSFGDLLKAQYAGLLGEGVHLLERMQAAAARMSTLIRDLLAFSRISTRQEVATIIPLPQVLRQVLIDLELLIGETGAQLSLEPLPTVSGDATQLGQLFQNLLANALKFHRAGVAPLIEVRCQQVDADALAGAIRPARPARIYHRIDVVDQGIGFEQRYAQRIFQVFQRLHGKSHYAGTGIGLAICEKVVANHGGAITATGQPGQGATFSVYLPMLADQL